MNIQCFSRFVIGILLGMLFATGVQAVPVSSTPYFFRTNILRTDGSTVDLLVIGTTVNPVQNTSAVATQGATTVVLQNSTASFLETSLPYNPDQLGPWTITVTNGPDTVTNVTNDLFGVQPLPFVSNIQIHGDLLTPTVSWELPVTSLPYTQVRIRVIDFAGGARVFTSNPLPANATAYVLPSNVLQPGRDYVLWVMLEEMRDNNLVNRSDARVTYTTHDGPVTIAPSEVYYFRRAIRQEGFADRDQILLDAVSVRPSAATTVTARSLVDPTVNVNLNFSGCGIYPNEFAAAFPFNSVPVDVATGGFTITAENSGIQDQVTTHTIVGVQPMAFVENVNISGNPLVPTVSWTLPTATAPFTEIRVRVWESSTNSFCIFSSFFSPSLPVTATTYSIPSGVLRGGSDRYLIQVRLSEVRNGVTINHSEVRVPHSTVGSSNQTALIIHYYVSILERDPDPDGLAFWEGLVAERQARGEDVKPVFRWMAEFFFFSPEYLDRHTTDRQFITNLYLTFFQRVPDEGGYAWWLEQLAQGMTRHHAMNGFLYSQEFTDFMEELGF